uniref:Uncharacterized protein n=1 Tax=Arundo donax TaxID=35708 RepID=A0A0A9EEC7_ARUDO
MNHVLLRRWIDTPFGGDCSFYIENNLPIVK